MVGSVVFLIATIATSQKKYFSLILKSELSNDIMSKKRNVFKFGTEMPTRFHIIAVTRVGSALK